jgi:DNA repair photolyase
MGNLKQNPSLIKGRGARIQPANPYLAVREEPDLEQVAEDSAYLNHRQRPPTIYQPDQSQSIVSENDSPDIPFRYSLNPYRGCSHGCIYCYARPTHEYLGLSAGLDFEMRVMVKERAPELFRQWLARPHWKAAMISFSGVTDCYQPAEREFALTRDCLAVAAECRQPVGVVTKNSLVRRDLDHLKVLAAHDAVSVSVSVSITTLDTDLARTMEPRTSSPAARLRTLQELNEAGIPTSVMVAPVIPGLNDSEIPAILEAARTVGTRRAAYLLLRLSGSVRPVFLDWLRGTLPTQAEKVESRIRSCRNGQLNDTTFGQRHRGTGPLAEQIAQTFQVFSGKFGFRQEPLVLNSGDFRPPMPTRGQLRLFP